MSVVHSNPEGNPTSTQDAGVSSPEQIGALLAQFCAKLRDSVTHAVEQGTSFDQVERKIWDIVRTIGFQAIELFVKLQGIGDLGTEIAREDAQPLLRSDQPVTTIVRSIFGHHRFEQFSYSTGQNRKVELYPINARLQLPENQWSYLLQEFSQLFCVDQSFNQAAKSLESIWGTKFSVDTLEQTSHRMGQQADLFLGHLPTPKKSDEAEILVGSADCKGVPLIKEDVAKVAAFETAKKNPGNRRMATVTSVYSVAPYARTAEDIVAALFRDDPKPNVADSKRPKHKHKHTTAHFPTTFHDGEAEIPISGIHEGMAWLADQVSNRRCKDQPLVLLMDGQECLWDIAAQHFDAAQVVPILDIIHVSSYVWEAAALFHDSRSEREAFTRERLLKILQGQVVSVIRGLRRMGSLQQLSGEKKADLARICGYFSKHQQRMKYDQYIKAGYPIASGVIEGACGHLVKDRMERSGMRWTLESARSMLNLRAAFQSDYWNLFQEQRINELSKTTHPNRELIKEYIPLKLAC